MIKKPAFFAVIFFLAFAIVPSFAFAQSTTSATIKKQTQERMAAIRETRQATKAAVLERKKELRETIMQKREEAKELFKAKREALKLKIEKIKDEKKKAVVERIDGKLSMVNTNRTDTMSANLEKLASILARIKEKGITAKTEGKDTTNLDAAVAAAETAIESAKNTVATQAGKEYIITITTESTLKNTIGKTTSQLQADLQTTHKAVVNAKQAVQKAAMELAKIGGREPKPKVGTNSAINQ